MKQLKRLTRKQKILLSSKGLHPRQLPPGDGDRDRPDCLRQIHRHLGTGTKRMNAGEKARNRHGLGIHRTGN